MTICGVSNVSIFNGHEVTRPVNLVFQGSPGDIINTHAAHDDLSTLDTVIEGTGCTLLPAFVDANVNIAAAYTDLRMFAAFGVATVLDMCSTTAEIQAMRAMSDSEIAIPAYFASGMIAAARDERTKQTKQRDSQALHETRVVLSPADAEAFVASQIIGPAKADYIQVLVDSPGLDDDTLAALVGSIHRHGKLAIAYATTTAAYTRVLQAGFDVVTPAPLDGIIDSPTATELGKRGIACIPSLCMRQKMMPHPRQERMQPSFAHNHPDWVSYDFNNALINVKKLHEAGVKICAGTNANQTSRWPVTVGESLHDELELLVRAGLSNMDALRAATFVPASVFKMLRDRGALQPGCRADMILLDGDPLVDITATRRIRKVWIQGIEVEAMDSY
ncbi:hypothetical protein G7046_g819 [Stylonectria norvegica]|nr:hypothetical protein G7046_g819 [Stylonectria norvegica]